MATAKSTSTTADAFYSRLSALQDPEGILDEDPRRLRALQKKVSTCVTRMFAKPENGGDPFMFALVSPKPHRLALEIGGQKIKTAATNGKAFFWNPDFLESLDDDTKTDQIGTVLKHEKGHVYRYHCDPSRGAGWDPDTRNIAFDYVVNGSLEVDHVKSGRARKYALFGGPLGEPLRLKELFEWIDGKVELKEGEVRCYSDPEAHTRTADSIYHEIQTHNKRSPRRCKKEDGGCNAMSLDPKTGKSKIPQPWKPGSCKKCGAEPSGGGGWPKTLDTHLQGGDGPSQEEVVADLMRAADFASQMRGSVPAEVEGMLKELREPTLSPHDIIVNCFQRRVRDVGDNKDHTRYVRRPQFIYEMDASGAYVPKHKLYVPKNYDHTPKWVCLLDTSGSMSDDNMADGLKELQIVASIHGSEGWVVPMDAKAYWDKKVEITTTTDLRRTRVHGRGGTTFKTAFEELPRELGLDYDVLVVVTDGYIDHIPPEYAPPFEVIWILTSGYQEFVPPFGRAVQLYTGTPGT